MRAKEENCLDILFKINDVITEPESAEWRVERIRQILADDEEPEELEFPVDEQKLKDFLEFFERVEERNTGVYRISGGFARAEYDGYTDDEDDPELLFRLQWGVQSDVQDSKNTEYYRIRIEDFNNAENPKEIYQLLEN